jgi:hypothetical protein
MNWKEILTGKRKQAKQKPQTGPPPAKYREMLIGIQQLHFRLDTTKEMDKMQDRTAQKILMWVKNANLDNLDVDVDKLRTEDGQDIDATSFDYKTERMHSSQFINIDGYSVKLHDMVRDQQKRSRTRGYRSVVSPQLIFNFEIEKNRKEIFYLSVKKNSWDDQYTSIDWRTGLNI